MKKHSENNKSLIEMKNIIGGLLIVVGVFIFYAQRFFNTFIGSYSIKSKYFTVLLLKEIWVPNVWGFLISFPIFYIATKKVLKNHTKIKSLFIMIFIYLVIINPLFIRSMWKWSYLKYLAGDFRIFDYYRYEGGFPDGGASRGVSVFTNAQMARVSEIKILERKYSQKDLTYRSISKLLGIKTLDTRIFHHKWNENAQLQLFIPERENNLDPETEVVLEIIMDNY